MNGAVNSPSKESWSVGNIVPKVMSEGVANAWGHAVSYFNPRNGYYILKALNYAHSTNKTFIPLKFQNEQAEDKLINKAYSATEKLIKLNPDAVLHPVFDTWKLKNPVIGEVSFPSFVAFVNIVPMKGELKNQFTQVEKRLVSFINGNSNIREKSVLSRILKEFFKIGSVEGFLVDVKKNRDLENKIVDILTPGKWIEGLLKFYPEKDSFVSLIILDFPKILDMDTVTDELTKSASLSYAFLRDLERQLPAGRAKDEMGILIANLHQMLTNLNQDNFVFIMKHIYFLGIYKQLELDENMQAEGIRKNFSDFDPENRVENYELIEKFKTKLSVALKIKNEETADQITLRETILAMGEKVPKALRKINQISDLFEKSIQLQRLIIRVGRNHFKEQEQFGADEFNSILSEIIATYPEESLLLLIAFCICSVDCISELTENHPDYYLIKEDIKKKELKKNEFGLDSYEAKLLQSDLQLLEMRQRSIASLPFFHVLVVSMATFFLQELAKKNRLMLSH